MPRHPAIRRAWIVLSLAALIFLVYWPSLFHGFTNYDDPDYVTANPHVQRGLSWEGVQWAFTATHAGNWHPLTWLSLMLDRSVGGPGPFGFHLTNVVLHSANMAILFLFLSGITGQLWRPALVAAIVAVHPLRVESVAWVAERKDVLGFFCGLLTLLAYASYARAPSLLRYGGVIALYSLCLLAKSFLVTLPCLMLLLDIWPLERLRQTQTDPSTAAFPARPTGRLILEKLPLLALSALASAATVHAQAAGQSLMNLELLPLGVRAANAVVSYARYVGKQIWIADLAVFYPYRKDWTAWQILGAATLLAAASIGAFSQRQRRPWLFVGWFWFLGTLVPVIGLVQSGAQSMSDRWSYFPSIGLLIALVWSIRDRWLASGRARTWLAALLMLTIAAFAAESRNQLRHWTDSESLFRHAIAATGPNWVACGALANALAEQRRYADAEQVIRQGIDAEPEFAQGWCNLGNLLAAQGRFDDAVAAYRRALDIRRELPEAHFNIGALAWGVSHRPDEAIHELQAAIALRPNYAEAYLAIGTIKAAMHDREGALDSLRAAARANPELPGINFRLAIQLSGSGDDAAAIVAYRRELSIDPGSTDSRNGLAWLLSTAAHATQSDGLEAVALLGDAVNATGSPVDPNMLDTYAAALARAGRFQDAARTAAHAAELARGAGHADLAAALEARLGLYRHGLPYTRGPSNTSHD